MRRLSATYEIRKTVHPVYVELKMKDIDLERKLVNLKPMRIQKHSYTFITEMMKALERSVETLGL